MKDELYEYACPQKRMTAERLQAEKGNRKPQTIDRIGYVSALFVLGVFSLPMALDNTLLWGMVLTVYLAVMIVNKVMDKDPYSGFLLSFGATSAYLGVVVSYLIIDGAYDRFEYSCLGLLVAMTAVLVACYECTVLLNMYLKRYTARLRNNKNHSAVLTAIGTVAGGVLGRILAKVISPWISGSLWSVWLVVLGCALLYMLAFSFFQKYLLYRILKNRAEH